MPGLSARPVGNRGQLTCWDGVLRLDLQFLPDHLLASTMHLHCHVPRASAHLVCSRRTRLCERACGIAVFVAARALVRIVLRCLSYYPVRCSIWSLC